MHEFKSSDDCLNKKTKNKKNIRQVFGGDVLIRSVCTCVATKLNFNMKRASSQLKSARECVGVMIYNIHIEEKRKFIDSRN